MADNPAFGPIRPKHILLLVSLAMIWGSSFMAIKFGVAHMSALELTAWRLVCAMVAMVSIAAIFRSAWPTGMRAIGYCFALSLFGNSLPFFLISWGEERIDSGLAAILMAVMPLTTLVLAHFFIQGDRLTSRKLMGVGLGFVGVVVLVGPEALKGLAGDLVRQLATAGGAVCYAISVIIVQRMPPTPMLGRAALTLVFSVLQTVPLWIILEGATMPALSAAVVWPPIYLGLIPTALATIILFTLLREREASFVAFQNYMVPVFGVFWGALLLSEVVSAQAVAALGLILVGIFVANSKRYRTT